MPTPTLVTDPQVLRIAPALEYVGDQIAGALRDLTDALRTVIEEART
jgi:hypothetical protein